MNSLTLFSFSDPTLKLTVSVWIKSCAILLIALMLYFLIRRASASTKSFLWASTFLGLLLVPLFSLFLPAWNLPVEKWLAEKAEPETKPQWEVQFSAPPMNSSQDFVSMEQLETMAETESIFPADSLQASELERSAFDFQLVLTNLVRVWISGVTLLLFALLLSVIRVVRLALNSSEIADEEWARLLRRVQEEQGIKGIEGIEGKVRLVIGPESTVPMTWSFFRTVVFLPSESETWNQEKRLAVLRHELAHVRRWDCQWQLLASFVSAIYWMNPLVWLAIRFLKLEQEKACDDSVIISGLPATDYADHLLKIAREFRPAPTLRLPAIAMTRRSQLETRLQSILDRKRRRTQIGWTAKFAIFVGIGLLVGCASTIETSDDAEVSTTEEATESSYSLTSITNFQNEVGRNEIYAKLNEIHLEEVLFDSQPLSEVVRYLKQESRLRDPEGKGINFLINPLTGEQAEESEVGIDLANVTIEFDKTLYDLSLKQVLDVIVRIANQPIRYTVEGWGVEFSGGFHLDRQQTFTKSYWVSPDAFERGLDELVGIKFGDGGGGRPVTPVLDTVRAFFTVAGISMEPPTTVFYSDSRGHLWIRAPLEDLDKVKSAIQVLNAESQVQEVTEDSKDEEATAASQQSERYIMTQDARVLLNIGQLEEAERLLRQVLAVEPDSREAREYLELVSEARLQESSTQITESEPSAETGERNSSLPASADSQLFTGTYRMNPNVFIRNLNQALEADFPDETWRNLTVQEKIRAYFESAGIDLTPPRMLFYNDINGVLLVRARLEEQELVRQVVQRLIAIPPLLNIKAKFVSIPLEDSKDLGFDLFVGNTTLTSEQPARTQPEADADSSNNSESASDEILTSGLRNTIGREEADDTFAPARLAGLLVDSQFRTMIRALEQRDGVDLVSTPELTTLSGMQAHFEATGIIRADGVDPGIPQRELSEDQIIRAGPKLDVIPQVQTDGYSVNLVVMASLTEVEMIEDEITGENRQRVTKTEFSNALTVWDGQTVVLGSSPYKNSEGEDHVMIVFVTPTILDPAGNRVNDPEDIPSGLPLAQIVKGFEIGAERSQIAVYLRSINARMIEESNNRILAEYQSESLNNPMRIELAFNEGKLVGVNYLPQ